MATGAGNVAEVDMQPVMTPALYLELMRTLHRCKTGPEGERLKHAVEALMAVGAYDRRLGAISKAIKIHSELNLQSSDRQ
jgi:hypothetical protein